TGIAARSEIHYLGASHHGRRSLYLTGDNSASACRVIRESLGPGKSVWIALPVCQAISFRCRSGGISDPHHGRHAHRANLSISPHRGALLSREADSDFAAQPPTFTRKRHVRNHRSRPLQVRQIGIALSEEHKEALSFLKSGIPTRNQEFNQLVERIEQVAVRSRDPV